MGADRRDCGAAGMDRDGGRDDAGLLTGALHLPACPPACLQAALADLNQRMEEPVPINRFRPNIVVAGAEPWAEDTWRSLKLVPQGAASEQPGLIELTSVKPCDR